MINLELAKEFMGIDFDDQDLYIQSLIDAVRFRAERIAGRPIDTPEADNAMLNDIAMMYQSRGQAFTWSEASLATYKRLAESPMF